MGMSDPDEPSSFNTHVDREFMERVTEAAVYRAPILEKAEIIRGWGGLYTITPDDNPIIGALPGIEGFFIMCGRSSFDLIPFAYDRFDDIKKEGEKRVV